MSSSSLSRLTRVNLLISEPAEGSAASAALDLEPAPTFGEAGLLVFTPSALLDLRKRFPLGLCSPPDCGDCLTDWAAAAAGGAGVGEVPRSEAGFSSCPTCLRLRMRLSISASRLRAAVWEPRRWGGGGGCSIWLLLTSCLLLLLMAAVGGAFFFKNLLPPPCSPPIELWGRRSWRISITQGSTSHERDTWALRHPTGGVYLRGTWLPSLHLPSSSMLWLWADRGQVTDIGQ